MHAFCPGHNPVASDFYVWQKYTQQATALSSISVAERLQFPSSSRGAQGGKSPFWWDPLSPRSCSCCQGSTAHLRSRGRSCHRYLTCCVTQQGASECHRYPRCLNSLPVARPYATDGSNCLAHTHQIPTEELAGCNIPSTAVLERSQEQTPSTCKYLRLKFSGVFCLGFFWGHFLNNSPPARLLQNSVFMVSLIHVCFVCLRLISNVHL